MDASKSKSAKQLKEHLQHQQEPFSLPNYLIERSYMSKSCNSNSSNIHRLYSGNNLKWSIKFDLHKIRKRFLHATGTLRSLRYKFIPTADNHEFSNWDEQHNGDDYYVHEITAVTQETQQTNELFSLKRLASSDHFTDNDVEDKVVPYEHHSSTLVNMLQTFTLPNLRRPEVDTDTKPCWISTKENKQQCYSRGSDWKESLPNAVCQFKIPETPATPLPTLSRKFVRDPVFSTYLRKLLLNSHILKLRRGKKGKLQEMVGTASLCQRNNRVLQKNKKKLPFDCVEKAREFHENEGKSLSIKAVSESEDLQSIIHEHFSFLDKQCREVKKITHLLHTESSITSQEWRNFRIVNRQIYMEIGDAIMDDIVTEIIDLFLV